MRSAEGRFAALPSFMRVRRYDAVDIVRSGVKVVEEKSEKQDVGAVLEVAGTSDIISLSRLCARTNVLMYTVRTEQNSPTRILSIRRNSRPSKLGTKTLWTRWSLTAASGLSSFTRSTKLRLRSRRATRGKRRGC